MQYTIQEGVQGICPPGWHLPTDEEWKLLEGTVDSQYRIGDPAWDLYGDYRGYDAGNNLKTISGWNENGNGTDLFGFSGLPGGIRNGYGNFINVCHYGEWWTSTEYGYMSYMAWFRYLSFDSQGVGLDYWFNGLGMSVRCLRDD